MGIWHPRVSIFYDRQIAGIKIGEEIFQRRLSKLKRRLEDVLAWPNPDNILREIIEKVKRQQPRILRFVEHLGFLVIITLQNT